MRIDNPNYIDSNYSLDISQSYNSLKYLNSYKQKPGNEVYNERQIDVNNYYIMISGFHDLCVNYTCSFVHFERNTEYLDYISIFLH